jgi:hypothetical protein
MFPEFIELLQEGNKQELFKRCFNRCYQAFDKIYEYEQAKGGSFWRFDERFYEHGIKILYERYCYAMAIIAAKFAQECEVLHGLKDAYDQS